MRNILKRHSGTPSGTRFGTSKFAQNWYFLCGSGNPRFLENVWSNDVCLNSGFYASELNCENSGFA